MRLEVPDPIRALLDGIELRRGPVPAAGIFAVNSLVTADSLTNEQRRGAWAEIAAWRFNRPHLFEASSWGTYWRELASGTNTDGQRVYWPDLQRELAIRSDFTNPKLFDPHRATEASDPSAPRVRSL